MDAITKKLTLDEIKVILNEIKKGNITVDYEAPDGCELKNGPDGTPYIVMHIVEDSPRYSPRIGYCHVKVKDYYFDMDGWTGEWESDFFYNLQESYKYKNGRRTTDEAITNKVVKALNKAKGVIPGPYYEDPAPIFREAEGLRQDIEGIWIDDYNALFDN